MELLLPIQLLVLLVAGYSYTETCYFVSANSVRHDGHRLYLRAAFYGLFFTVVGLLSYVGLYIYIVDPHFWLGEWFGLRKITKEYFWLPLSAAELMNPFTQGDKSAIFNPQVLNSLIAINVLILLGGLSLGHVINQILNLIEKAIVLVGYQLFQIGLKGLAKMMIENTPKTIFLRRILRTDKRELMLLNAMERGMPICFTMKSGKVYVGVPTNSIDPSEGENSHFTILPFRSGYRDGNYHVCLTLDYFGYFSDLYLGDGEYQINLEEFHIVLPYDEIQSMNFFHDKVFEDLSSAITESKSHDRNRFRRKMVSERH